MSISKKINQKTHLAQFLSRAVLVFVIGSTVGFVLETVWILVLRGRYELRSSLLFLPMSTIYGFGSVALYVCFHNTHKRRVLFIFLLGFVIGSLTEYIGSFLQESFLHSTSWHYSQHLLNIDGRICLLNSLVWGLLALVWKWSLEPLLDWIFDAISISAICRLAVVLMMILAVNSTLSVMAVHRWNQRLNDLPPDTALSAWLDSQFPDDFMRQAYPSMRFAKSVRALSTHQPQPDWTEHQSAHEHTDYWPLIG